MPLNKETKWKKRLVYWLSLLEMESVIQVQILD